MAYNTNNPIPSSSPFDLFDNASIFDKYINGTDELVYDRKGLPRWTPHAFHNLVINAKAQIDPTVTAAKNAVNASRDSGIQSINQSVAAVDAVEAVAIAEMQSTAASLGEDLNNKHASTYAQLVTMPQTRDAVVAVVDADPDDNKNGWYYWSQSSSAWVRFANDPAMRKYLDSLIGRDSAAAGALEINDEDGFSIASISKDGSRVRIGPTEIGLNGINSPAFGMTFEPGDKVLITDPDGFIIADLADPSSIQDEIDNFRAAERNASNLASSAAVVGEINATIQRPICKYNHFLWFGQSLGTGYEGWPALSKDPKFGNLMFGDSPRPSSATGAAFVPVGGSALKPLRSVVQSIDGATILTDAEVAVLAPGSGNEGEGSEVGAMNMCRKLFLQQQALAADPQRLFVTSNAGRAGRTLEQLSKGANPNLYLRLIQAAQGVKAIADAEEASYCVPALVFMQGEYNYTDAYGGDATKEGYKTKLLAQAKLWKEDVAIGIAGQADDMAIITYQTGASYTSDANDLAIGMAQWELSKEQHNWYMATPVYPYTDKGGHMDPNGYRWIGAQIGKVLHRVVTLGQGWKPLSPIRATLSAKEILVDFHVPCPPLAFDSPYVVLTPTNYPDKGFRVVDSVGVIAIRSVAIVSETQVMISLDRDASGDVKVQYASKTGSNGNGSLRDSDPTVSIDNYVYQAGTGQYAGANITALVGKPYPLHNWCIAFSISAASI